MEDKTLTVQQALDAGYKYACDETCEFFKSLDKLDAEDFEYHSPLFLAEKEGFGFSGISAGTLKEMCIESIENQDEVGNDDGDLEEELETVDWDSIASQINSCFKKKYYWPSDVKLIP